MRSLFCTAILTLLSSMLCAAGAQAAPIEFEFGGVFTQTTGTVHQVGAPFTSTVRFDLSTPDLNPSPLLGRYTYLSWTAPYRNATPIVLAPPSGAIEILAGAGGGSHGWQLDYSAVEFGFELDIDYPVGYFASDALPATLDLSGASATRFNAFAPGLGVDLRGTITSFRVVPEPTVGVCFSFPLVLTLRRLR